MFGPSDANMLTPGNADFVGAPSPFSAAGGFDIPSGLNPKVQAHAEEMILPAPIANGIRKMVDGGSNGDVTINVVNQSGQNVKAKDGGTTFDAKGMVKTIILEAMDNDPGFKWAMRGAA